MGVQERKEREREQRRHDILEAARSVFTEHGIQNASMDKIAAEAELAKGTLYLYYKSRDELVLALLTQDLESLASILNEVATANKPADERLLDAFRTFYTFSETQNLFYQVMTTVNISEVASCVGTDGDAFVDFQNKNEAVMNVVVSLVKEGIEKKIIHVDRPVEYVVMQLILALKGSMVILENKLLPQHYSSVNKKELMDQQGQLLVCGLKYVMPTAKTIKASKQRKPATALKKRKNIK